MITSLPIFEQVQYDNPIPITEEQLKLNELNLNAARRVAGITCVRPVIYPEEIVDFVRLAKKSKKKAIESLLEDSFVNFKTYETPTHKLLFRLYSRTDLDQFSYSEIISVFYTLADIVDDLSRINGPVALMEQNPIYTANLLSNRLLKQLPVQKRKKAICKAIKYGKARSWIIYFAWRLVTEHGKENKESRFRKKPWLSPEELPIYVNLAKTRLKRILEEGFKETSNPYYLFRFWHEIADEDEMKIMNEWITENTKSDLDFLRFIDVFSEKMVKKEKSPTVKFIYTILISKLNFFIEFDEVSERLRKIKKSNKKYSDLATELIERLEYGVNLTEERKNRKVY